jgi:hypothetical protein
MKEGFDFLKRICISETPTINYFLYSEERNVVYSTENGDFRLICEVIRTKGNPKTILDVNEIREAQMEVEKPEESYHTKYLKLLHDIKQKAMLHCDKCREACTRFEEEIFKCPIEGKGDYVLKLKEFSIFCEKYDIPNEIEYDNDYEQRCADIVTYFNENVYPEPYIMAFRYFDIHRDDFKVFFVHNNGEQLRGGKFILELLNYIN